ncbi:MAG: hypothetical protein JW808_10555 [Victivallales bacterium]|nr:hypothetical protein [Victivallales bacterium]
MNDNRLLNIAMIFCAAMVFLMGVANLFHLRFSQGDIYPRYSSFRPDPMGCKALYDSYLESGLECSRNFSPVKEICDPKGMVLLRTAIASYWRPQDDREMLAFVLAGGTFAGFYDPSPFPRRTRSASAEEPCCEEDDVLEEDEEYESPENPTQVKDEEGSGSCDPGIIAEDAAHLQTDAVSCMLDTDSSYEGGSVMAYPQEGYFPEGSPPPLVVHSGHYLVPGKAGGWQTIYSSDSGPVGVAARFGDGRIFLFSCSYPVSNEALKNHRNSHMLAHIAEGATKIVFDEHHLGVEESRNIAWLFKKYKLELLVGNLVLIALLLLWRNFCSIENVPEPGISKVLEAGVVESGFSRFSGLNSLVSNGIPKDSLIKTCLGEWLKTARNRVPDGKIERVKDICNNNKNNIERPLDVYTHVSRVLRERRTGDTR